MRDTESTAPAFRVGDVVEFEDGDGRTHRGEVIALCSSRSGHTITRAEVWCGSEFGDYPVWPLISSLRPVKPEGNQAP